MAQDSYPSSARASGVLSDNEVEQLQLLYVPTGIVGTPADPYPVKTQGDASRGVRFVADVFGLVHGCLYSGGSSDTILNAAANGSGQTRFDLAAWELDRSANNAVRAVLVTGTPGAGAPPNPLQETDDDGVWQFAIASIEVPNGASTLDASKTHKLGWWIPLPKLITSTSSRRPPGAPKTQEIYEWETDTKLVGNGSSWVGPIANSGSIPIPDAANWDAGFRSPRVYKINGVVHSILSFQRSGSALPPHTPSKMGTIPAGYRPPVDWPIGGYFDGGVLWEGHVDAADGGVYLDFTYGTVGNGAEVVAFGSGSWPAA